VLINHINISHSYVNWCQLSVMNYRENVVQLTGFL